MFKRFIETIRLENDKSVILMKNSTMINKTLALTITILVMVLVILGIVFLKKKNVEITDVYQVIPPDAALIIESRTVAGIATKWKELVFLRELKQTKVIDDIYYGLQFLDSLNIKNSFVHSLLNDNPLIVSLHLTGKNDCNALFYIKLKERGQDKYILDYITNLTNKRYERSDRKYEHIRIYDFDARAENCPGDFSCVFTDDIFIFSFSSLLLESAVRHTAADKNLRERKGFAEVYTTAGKYVDANIYINYEYAHQLASVLLAPAKQSCINETPLLANWTELDLIIKNNTLLLNGFTFCDDSANLFLNLFLHQEPQKTSIEEILPADVAAFMLLGIEDYMQFRNDYIQYLTQVGKVNAYHQEITNMNALTGINVEEIIQTIMEGEIAMVVTSNTEYDTKTNTLAILKTKSRSETKGVLFEVIQHVARKKKKNTNEYKHIYKVDSETSFDIYEFPVSNLTRTLFGNIFSNAENNYFVLMDNYLVFGPSVRSLSDFMYKNVLHKTINNDANYRQFTEYLSGKTNLYFFCNTDKGYEYISQFLSNPNKKRYKEHFEFFKKFRFIACQFNSNNDMMFTNCAVHYISENRKETHTVWESLLDTVIEFKPKLVINHITNDKEIFIQDVKNTIYLINKAGRIQWKLPLQEKILSDIYQIDYYQNNKLQLLFNTKNQIHLLDRNGNYVERFPVTFRSPATNALALFDYEKNKDYRIVVAGEDRQIYIYDKEGNIVPGWNFEGSETIVDKEIQYFRMEDKDYLVFADKNRVYILDRKGNARVTLVNQIKKSANNLFILEEETTNSKARLVTTDTSGRVFYIYFDGKIEKLSLGHFTSDHFFDYQDFNADGKKDYIFLDQKKLLVLDQNMKEVFSRQFNEEITSPPVYYLFSQNDRKLGVVSGSTNQIYLFSKDGTTYKGFPLRGHTPFSIGIFQETGNNFNLIVGSSDGFLYNYSVQ